MLPSHANVASTAYPAITDNAARAANTHHHTISVIHSARAANYVNAARAANAANKQVGVMPQRLYNAAIHDGEFNWKI